MIKRICVVVCALLLCFGCLSLSFSVSASADFTIHLDSDSEGYFLDWATPDSLTSFQYWWYVCSETSNSANYFYISDFFTSDNLALFDLPFSSCYYTVFYADSSVGALYSNTVYVPSLASIQLSYDSSTHYISWTFSDLVPSGNYHIYLEYLNNGSYSTLAVYTTNAQRCFLESYETGRKYRVRYVSDSVSVVSDSCSVPAFNWNPVVDSELNIVQVSLPVSESSYTVTYTSYDNLVPVDSGSVTVSAFENRTLDVPFTSLVSMIYFSCSNGSDAYWRNSSYTEHTWTGITTESPFTLPEISSYPVTDVSVNEVKTVRGIVNLLRYSNFWTFVVVGVGALVGFAIINLILKRL